MFKDLQERITRKIQPDFHKYSIYIIFSILLGIGLEFKLFDMLFDKPVQLINQFLNQFLNLSNSNPIDHSLVFSTSAAILSTVFTIIFVLLTVFIQMSGAHTSEDVLQSNETKNLMRLYFVTIVFSLIMLETTFQFPIIVLTLTFACILSLYPFLRNISNKFQYEIGVGKLSEEISSLMDANNESPVLAKMKSLKNISIRSIDDKRFYDFLNIISIIENNTERAEQLKMGTLVKVIGYYYLDVLNHAIKKNSIDIDSEIIIMTLFDTINSYFNNCSELINHNSLHSQINSLKETGIKMIKAGFASEYVDQIIEIFYSIFLSVQKKVNIENSKRERVGEAEIGFLRYKIEPDIVRYIGELVTELFNRKSELSSFSTPVGVFFRIGARTHQVNEKFGYLGSSTPVFIVKELKKIENNIGADNFEKLFKDSKKYIFHEPELEQYMDKFKMYYHEQKKCVN